jgi:hypothetical protein
MSTRPAFLFGGFCGNALEEDAVLRDSTQRQTRDAQLPEHQSFCCDTESLYPKMPDQVFGSGQSYQRCKY